jgi:hypothetical protein
MLVKVGEKWVDAIAILNADGTVATASDFSTATFNVTGVTGTEYTEDVASIADPVGTQLIARRRDSLSTETSATGDNTALNSTAKGELYVKHVDAIPITDNGGSLTVDGNVSAAQSGAWNIGTVTTVTDVVHIDDNSGSLTVDNNGTFATQAQLQTGDNIVGRVKLTDGSNTVTLLNLTNSKAVPTALVDASGNQITSFGGGTQYTEDAASAADPVGNALIGRRRDALSTETTTDGDNTALNATGKGELYVKHVDALPITDNSGSLTVDQPTGSNLHTVVDSGTITTVSTVTNLSQLGGTAVTMGTGVRTSGTQRVTIATDDVVPVAQSGSWTIGTVSTVSNVVHVDDNSGSLTIDAPVATPVYVRLSDGVSAIATLPVSVASLPSTAVTNAGTFATQATLAAETTKVIGTVNISASQTVGLVAGTALVGKVGLDQTTPGTTNAVSLAQIGSTTVATGNGVVSAGVQRVAIASDNSTIPANTALVNGATTLTGNGVTGTGSQRVTVASDNTPFAIKIDQTTNGTTNAVYVIEASDILDLTLSTDTNIYASGDVLADSQVLASVARVNDGTARLESLMVCDADDQGSAMDIVFLKSNVSLGTENSAPSISDANAKEILGVISIAASDWIDLGGCRIANASFAPFMLKAASGTTGCYVAAISRGTPTYTATGLSLKIGIARI